MKNAEIVSQIYKTEDYDQFKFIKENRKLNLRNYAKLVASMEEEQLLIPILVNHNMEIIDGQHRFTSCQELGLPVFFYVVEGYGLKAVQKANMVGCVWTLEDFLNMNLESQKPEYTNFKEVISKYGIRTNDLLKLFSIVQGKNLRIITKNFEEGTFALDGMDTVIDFLEAWNDFNFFKYYKTRSFSGAFMKLFFQKDYDHTKMQERLRTRSPYFQHRSTIDEYLLLLTKEIYSFGAIKKPLYYDIDTKKFYS